MKLFVLLRAWPHLALALAFALMPGSTPTAVASAPPAAPDSGAAAWMWPVNGARMVLEPYRAPAHAYGAGHRGIDVAAPVGTPVRAPASGVVAFRGSVVDRPLVTLAHDGGLVTTFEPVDSELMPGDIVAAGDVIGEVAVGGHTSPGALHIGVRVDGAYINPMMLFGEAVRAVLLPCCESG